MEEIKYPDDLVTLITAETPFQASIHVAVLEDAGIKAHSFGAINALEPVSQRLTPVVVQVRRADLEAARAALRQNATDSVDLNWDEVDVGEREDNLPLKQGSRMPLMAQLGFAVAVLLLITIVVLAIDFVIKLF